jgi:hypothetical protein
MEPGQVTICRSNADCVVAFGNGIAVACWRYHTQVLDIHELAAAARRAHEASGAPIGMIQLVAASAITPDGQARSAIAHMLQSLHGVVSHSAIVHEAEGFRAAMIRSIVTGLAAISNPGFPHRVFAKLPDAAAWMAADSRRLSALQIVSTATRARSATPKALPVARPAYEAVTRSL